MYCNITHRGLVPEHQMNEATAEHSGLRYIKFLLGPQPYGGPESTYTVGAALVSMLTAASSKKGLLLIV